MITLINLDPAASPLAVTIQRPSGSALDQNGVISSGVFGVYANPLGLAYFASGGAAIGEGAALGYDGSTGNFYLAFQTSGGTLGGSDDQHLMQVRRERLRSIVKPVRTFSLAPQRNLAWRRKPVNSAQPTGSVPARPWKPLGTTVSEPRPLPTRPWRPSWAM